MAVVLNVAYGGYAAGAIVQFPDSTESALIAQGLARAATGQPAQVWPSVMGFLQEPTFGGNASIQHPDGIAVPTAMQGPRIWPNGPILAFASLGTNTTLVAGTQYRCEIYVPYLQTWTGISLLNGATVGTDNHLVALYDTNGAFIASSALAGSLSAGANAFQDRAFVAPGTSTAQAVTLPPGRYFIVAQSNGTTATLRTWAAANGGNQMTGSATGTFGTLATSFTPPTTFTADVGPIARLYV